MIIGIIYQSMTGHSKKIAYAIGQAIKQEPQNIKHNPKLGKLDLLFVTSGIYGGVCHKGLLAYLQSLDKTEIKRVALITSCCGGSQKQDAARALLVEKGIPVVIQEYVCIGNFLFFRLGHPNKAEIQGAVDFAKSVIAGITPKKQG